MSATRDPAIALAERVLRAAVRRGARRVLLLDLDGTLAPLAPTPEEAEVPAATLEILRALRDRWTVAIVSGRALADVQAMVPLCGIVAFGGHGLEGHWPGNRERRIPSSLHRRLATLSRRARTLGSAYPGVHIERKPWGLTFHDRGVAREELAPWRRERDRWLSTQPLDGIELLEGKRLVELRPRGAHKGLVIDAMPWPGPTTEADESLVAIGDDRTDEDMFRVLAGRGLAVRVGRPRRRTLARARLPSPVAVRRFLAGLAGRARPAGPAVPDRRSGRS